MKHLVIAMSTLAFLAGAPLAAQAATSSAEHHSAKHATVRHHANASKGHMNQAKNHASCPAGSTSAACQPSSTGSVK
jgi:hypothetical protein